MSAPAVTVRGLSKRFGAKLALDAIDLEVAPSELLVVLGPTGAGKTTLLRILAGLETPDTGAILMDGRSVAELSPAARDIALVFQNFSLYPSWSVRRNLEFPLRAPGRNLDRAEIERRVAWAAELLRIPHLLDRDSRRLSGGEMQRVAIGRAIVRRPKLFLMDEPLTNLDAKLRESLRVELASLVRELGTPMIYVTHDQAEALSMADRIAVLAEGRLLQVGSPSDVYLRPDSAVVARQLGSPPINVLLVRREGDQWVDTEGAPLAPCAANAPQRALLGIRPEHVAISGGATAGRVEVVEDTGPARILLVRWAGTRIHVLTERSTELRPGAVIHPAIDARRAVLWPQDAPGD